MFSYNKHEDQAHQSTGFWHSLRTFPRITDVSAVISVFKYLNLEKKKYFLTEICYGCSCFGMSV